MIPWLIALLIAVTSALLLSRFLGLFKVQGVSMLPTLKEGDWLLGRRYLPWETPNKGEIIVLLPGEYPCLLVKRIFATPGEELPPEVCASEGCLPEARYLLQSDNTELPPASRWIGPVERKQIWGKVGLVIWLWRRKGRLR
jgi:signal peptidase I